jgi:hypothetical protein
MRLERNPDTSGLHPESKRDACAPVVWPGLERCHKAEDCGV